MSEPVTLTHAGLTATVTKNQGHPEYYLWIDVAGGGHYFLGVLEPGMTRADVRRMAERFLERRAAG